jgi:hypothetical protein
MENNALPSNYIKQYDPNYQRDYFVNTDTGISTWEDPRLAINNQIAPPPFANNMNTNGTNQSYPQQQFNNQNQYPQGAQTQYPQQGAQTQYSQQGAQNQYPQQAYGGNQQQQGGYQQHVQGNGHSQQQYAGKPSGSGGIEGLLSQAAPIIASLMGGKKPGKKPGKLGMLGKIPGFKF